MPPSTTADVRQHILDTAKPIMLRKGFSAVGLNEILQAAGVPKGSFYHYFGSKEAFGEALLESYFTDYLTHLEQMLVRGEGDHGQRLLRYWTVWQNAQKADDPEGKCLAVKLGAEVCDLSQAMRGVLERGTGQIVQRLGACIEAALRDGSLRGIDDPYELAATLYQLWLGATLLGKFRQDGKPFALAMAATRQLLKLS
ncbi:TetR/AcrR family transcriptional regulator [Cupriavidus sp. UGS-1]|uniref:TetR/AcrR family transcriptional regulator n=1 Tax=Cupriavidus sp. UGS-1 TaxID=2899826 RepID=UPI001E560B95|nr:TetR/AcrR family transcriptional regulator [Cupriavidus sp. UGS-1]MCD9119637.1 TetR/AcrR family transcriptional regulator [Cupriavidus sp. UGS-1]